jgi:hypothetical protein
MMHLSMRSEVALATPTSPLAAAADGGHAMTKRQHKYIDITGQRFGRLTAIRPAGIRPQAKRPTSGEMWWHCKCDCGRSTISKSGDLRRKTRSCGCTRTHGHSQKHPLYPIWKTMRQRCLNPANADYRWYGARGITVCERWNDFTNFLADVGERPSPELTLDRIDVNGNYEPGNIRWATWEQQRQNKRPRATFSPSRVE